jgi:hypothetical protein
MKKAKKESGVGMKFMKRAVPFLATGGFFLAAFILSAVVWNPAIAETPNSEGTDTSLLLTLDKPVAPVSRAIALDEDTDEAIAASTELVTELNTWTFTAGPHHHHGHPGGGGQHHPHHPHHNHPPHPHHHHPSGFH